MIQVIVNRTKSDNRKSRYITYTFNSFESARNFIAKFNLENKIVDILN